MTTETLFAKVRISHLERQRGKGDLVKEYRERLASEAARRALELSGGDEFTVHFEFGVAWVVPPGFPHLVRAGTAFSDSEVSEMAERLRAPNIRDEMTMEIMCAVVVAWDEADGEE